MDQVTPEKQSFHMAAWQIPHWRIAPSSLSMILPVRLALMEERVTAESELPNRFLTQEFVYIRDLQNRYGLNSRENFTIRRWCKPISEGGLGFPLPEKEPGSRRRNRWRALVILAWEATQRPANDNDPSGRVRRVCP